MIEDNESDQIFERANFKLEKRRWVILAIFSIFSFDYFYLKIIIFLFNET